MKEFFGKVVALLLLILLAVGVYYWYTIFEDNQVIIRRAKEDILEAVNSEAEFRNLAPVDDVTVGTASLFGGVPDPLKYEGTMYREDQGKLKESAKLEGEYQRKAGRIKIQIRVFGGQQYDAAYEVSQEGISLLDRLAGVHTDDRPAPDSSKPDAGR